MNERNVSVRKLIELLPDLVEFDALRQELFRASESEESQSWNGPSSYSTVDRRVVPLSELSSLTSEGEGEVRSRVKRLHEAASLAFSTLAGANATQKTAELVALGETAEQRERWREAAAYYLLACGVVRASSDLKLRALAFRRAGRASLNIGDFARAKRYYSASLAAASTAADTGGQITAAIGLGSLAAFQGRWPEADNWFENATNLCDEHFTHECAQLAMNRAAIARECQKFAEAKQFLERAAQSWDVLSSADRAAWYNHMGLLLAEEGKFDDAEACFDKALDSEMGPFQRALTINNLAEVALRRGALAVAEARCREAEEHGITHGSPRALAETYLLLGQIAARREDINGVTFFEKALELTRDQEYPLLRGQICREYALFRKTLGEDSAAQTLFQQALEQFVELGALSAVQEVQDALRTLTE